LLAACAIAALAATLGACRPASRPVVTPDRASAASRPSSAATRQLERDIDARLATAPLEHGTWGVVIRSLSSGETLYARNGRKLLMPASNMKTVTLAAAAQRLGWDFSFETRLEAAGRVDGARFDGDLVVVGHGDPTLDDWDGAATRLFGEWAAGLKAHGIEVISGRIVGDDNAMEDAHLGSGWAWDDLDRSYAASVGALQFNENTARLTVAPGAAESQPATASLSPEGSGLVLRNLVTTVAAGEPPSVRSRRLAGTPVLELAGSVPLAGPAVVRNVSVYNPTIYFAHALRAALIANGIDVQGPAVDIDEAAHVSRTADPVLLSFHRSPPLSVFATTMMKDSQNLYAETLLQAVGGPGEVRLVLERWGIPIDDFLIADGSGLSRYNLVTAEGLVVILTRIARDDRLRDPFQATLPIAGRDGTLAQRMKGTAAEGNARAKTGSFSNARALSGYVRTADGETLVFAILSNNFGVSPDVIEQTIDDIVVKLAQFKR
jgi:D-alanyl-D-alanine carboxypeptidase/D-alanyl-D-alanine-endopeptidase (penicillin-binding protein 4)